MVPALTYISTAHGVPSLRYALCVTLHIIVAEICVVSTFRVFAVGFGLEDVLRGGRRRLPFCGSLLQSTRLCRTSWSKGTIREKSQILVFCVCHLAVSQHKRHGGILSYSGVLPLLASRYRLASSFLIAENKSLDSSFQKSVEG